MRILIADDDAVSQRILQDAVADTGHDVTMVTDGSLLNVYAWYDNETGCACRMVDLANLVLNAGV